MPKEWVDAGIAREGLLKVLSRLDVERKGSNCLFCLEWWLAGTIETRSLFNVPWAPRLLQCVSSPLEPVGEMKMETILYPFLLALVILSPASGALADDSKELRKERQDAQRARQHQVSERNKAVNEATRAFREYTRDLKTEYREQTKDLDNEFKLREVDLKADHDARVASAEAEYQKKLTALFMNPGGQFTEQRLEQMHSEARAFSDALFDLKKQSAEELHAARMANEESKSALWAQMDELALDKAESLGLTRTYPPILATPIGDELTTREERWNEKEQKDVAKLEGRNSKALSEFRNGAALRKWELENLNEDFKLTWEEQAKLHELDSEQGFYNTLFMQAAQGGQVDQQKLMAQMAELNEQKKLIGIEYKKIRDKNRITRRQERKAILAK